MSWSLGEIRALSIKAAKGAGFTWGQAEEAGFAVQWLEARCAPGVEALAQYLSTAMATNSCPIITGCAISDAGQLENHLGIEICQALLLAPFISSTLENETITLKANDTKILISHMDVFIVNYQPSAFNEAHRFTATMDGVIPETSSCKSRVLSDQNSYIEILNQFAHKTYAPSTEESRLAGAGAGTSDND